MYPIYAFMFISIVVITAHPIFPDYNDEALARDYIREFEEKYWPQADEVQKFLMIDLNDLTDTDIQAGDSATFNIRNFTLDVYQKLKTLSMNKIRDPLLRRQAGKVMKLKDWLLEDKDLAKKISFQPLINKISKQPGICCYENRTRCDLSYDGHVRDIIINSNDPKELEFYWVQWRDLLDQRASIFFEEYMKIIRKSGRLNGFNATSQYWYDDYERLNIINDMELIIRQIEPFYKELHAYLRFILRKRYGTNIVSAKGPIPEHLLEKLWLEGMEKIQFYEDFNSSKVFPNIGARLIDQGYTGMRLVEESDRFYQSLGLPPLSKTFWSNSSHVLADNKNSANCRPIVYDFGREAGLKYCSKVNFRTYLEDHAIMSKVQLHEHVKNLPYGLNVESCPGMWKVFGKAVKLSSSSVKHLRELGLYQNPTDEDEMSINSLLHMAVHTFFKMPMYYVYEKLYAMMLDHKVKPEEYNCVYWKLLEEWTGVEAPTKRDNDDFDVSKPFYKVTQSSMPLATKLVSETLGFHLYEMICIKIGQFNQGSNKPLKECNFYNRKEAGDIFRDVMSQGWTKPCFDVIESFTKQRTLSAHAMLEYFRPLYEWLQQKNKANNEFLGWIPSNKCSNDE